VVYQHCSTLPMAYGVTLGAGKDLAGKRCGHVVPRRCRTISSTSSDVEHSRHSVAMDLAVSAFISERVCFNRGIDDAVMLSSVAPSPTSMTA
jgi:hypothetical protein